MPLCLPAEDFALTTIIAAMTPNGGGREKITSGPKALRKYNGGQHFSLTIEETREDREDTGRTQGRHREDTAAHMPKE